MLIVAQTVIREKNSRNAQHGCLFESFYLNMCQINPFLG